MTKFLNFQVERFHHGLVAMALALSLACTPAFAQTTPNSGDGAASTIQTSIKLAGVIVAMPVGTIWLSVKTGLVCSGERTLTWTDGRVPQDLALYSGTFRTELQRAGYKVVTPGEDNLFDPESGAADYQAAAVITDVHLDVCLQPGGAFFKDHVKGTGAMKVDWQIYSPIKKQVVARVSTSATIDLTSVTFDMAGPEQALLEKFAAAGLPRLVQDAFAASIRELANNADFHTAMNAPGPLTKGFVLPGQQNKIALAGSLKAGPRPIADAVGSVVTLIASDGSGSGVLVSNDGYFLTNAHVVGDEKTIRVRWSDGIETLGQVMRVAKDRDVALVKTSSRDRIPFAIKHGAVTPGQKVYAIGSPKGQQFQGTVTSGVISTTRIMDGLRYIQSDATVSFGSSGGALLDETGSLIGLTDLGVTNAGQPAGLNLFIPIGDAIDFLSLEQQ